MKNNVGRRNVTDFCKVPLCVSSLFLSSVVFALPAENSANNHLFSPALNGAVVENTIMNHVQQDKIKVEGKVLDENGEPVIGANVLVKGTTIGAITDFDGFFTLNVPSLKNPLRVTYLGYSELEVKPQAGKLMVITLKEDSETLEEVVVVGYGVQKKESVVGAVSQVQSESLIKSGNSDITSAIAGKLSGVLTMQQNGQPGSSSTDIVIRGVSSWNGSKPLVLVDGVERSFSDIDPNEVNTISVLKDASATAVFGAKGANGVIIVTTKRGVEGKPKLDFSASYGMQVPTRVPDHIDAYTTMSMYNEAVKNSGKYSMVMPQSVLDEYRHPSSRLNSLRYPDVDWFDLLTKEFASTVNANVNLRGGTKFVKYFASLGYTHEGTMFESFHQGHCDTRYRYDRLNYRVNLDFNLTNSTVFSFNVGGNLGVRNSPSKSPWEAMFQASTAMYPAYYPEWALEEVPDLYYPDATGIRLADTQDTNDNPYTLMNQGKFSRNTSSQLYTDLILKQNLDFITKGLSFTGKFSLSTNYSMQTLKADWNFPSYQLRFDRVGTNLNPWQRLDENNDIWVQPPLDINVGGLGGHNKNLYYEFSLNYNRKFGQHTVSGLLLMNRSKKNSGTDFAYYNEAWVARATYDYKHKYLFEMNLGYTGSERFAPSNRFGFFPSFALGWVPSEEKWFKENVKWMSKLKFRYSDGKVGSDSAPDRWLYMGEYTNSGSVIYEGKTPNFTAQWEEARKKDFGIEMGFFNNMITLGFDFFDEQRSKMLLTPRSTTPLIGNNGFKSLNKGEMKKHGLEIEAGFNKKTAYGLNYHLNAMISFNENRIIEKDDLPYAPDYQKDAGKAYGGQYSGVVTTGNGYYTSVDDIHNYVTPVKPSDLMVGDYRYLDYTGDGQITNLDLYPIEGSKYAPVSYSFGGGLSYKNFDFNILFQGNAGKWVTYNESFEIEFNQGCYRVHESQRDYWSPTNRGANHAALHFDESGTNKNFAWAGGSAYHGYKGMIQDRFWRKADYLRLKEIYLGYNVAPKFLNSLLGISKVTLYATANNVFTITNLVEGDPEASSFTKGFYPQMSTYKFGLKVHF